MFCQSEAAECGLACVAMVANSYGHQLDLTTLRNRYSVSLKGANLQQLMQLAGQGLGMKAGSGFGPWGALGGAAAGCLIGVGLYYL